MDLDPFEIGLLVGVLVGEGSFGGDGRQPSITVRMHIRHEALFRRLVQIVPGSRLYGPYNHSGREYFQWLVRGPALRNLVATLDRYITPDGNPYSLPPNYSVPRKYDAVKDRWRLVQPTPGITFSGFRLPGCDSFTLNGGGAQVNPI